MEVFSAFTFPEKYNIPFPVLYHTVAVLGQLDDSWLTLAPSTPSITHFVNDSFIIFCKTVQKDASAKWKDPKGKARENTKGRVHIEKKTGEWGT